MKKSFMILSALFAALVVQTGSAAASQISFIKTVADLTSGVNPATKAAAPGDKLRYTLRFRARLPEINDVRNRLIAHAVIGSQEQHSCSMEHAR
jgi:hypothetical protein